MPSRQILENLKSSADVLQNYRDKTGKPIKITSGWRTPTEQQRLINAYNRKDGTQKNKPSETNFQNHICNGMVYIVIKFIEN